MAALVFKLVSAPILLAIASLVGRRWGASVGGALAAIPIVIGSISFFVTLEQGPDFGSRTAAATLVGICSLAWFSVAYAHTSRRSGWPISLVMAYTAVAITSLAVIPLSSAPGFVVFAIAILNLAVAYRLMPAVGPAPRPVTPAWDIPARMIAGTALVLVLTGAAQSLGPQLSGLLAAFPMVFTVLLVFTHRHEGSERARGLLRGFVVGLAGTSLFAEVLADGLPRLGLGWTFLLAIVAFVAYQTLVIQRLSRGQTGQPQSLAALPAEGLPPS